MRNQIREKGGVMPESVKTVSEVDPELMLCANNHAGSRDTSAPAGIFFHRRSRYFSQASGKTGQGVSRAENAQAAIAAPQEQPAKTKASIAALPPAAAIEIK